jgi:hypothetical protein
MHCKNRTWSRFRALFTAVTTRGQRDAFAPIDFAVVPPNLTMLQRIVDPMHELAFVKLRLDVTAYSDLRLVEEARSD